MSSQGPNFPTAATGNTNAIGGGTVAWTNPTNIEANDGNQATCLPGVAITDDLRGGAYGFTVPATATINGILLEVNGSAFVGGIEAFHTVVLEGGGGASANRAAGVLGATPSTFSFGGASDLWGTTWTPAQINAGSFVANVTFQSTGGGPGTVGVDFFRVTVFFTTPPPTVTSCTPSFGPPAGGTSITNLAGTNFVATPTVTFGGTAATSVVFVSSTKLTCVTPAHSGGAVNIVVTNPDTQTGTLVGGFIYGSPAQGSVVAAIF